MSLRIYNTLRKDLEEFEPLEKGKVKLYVCGPTVYDLLHVGNFRGAVFFNLVRNWLVYLGYKVTFVYNYTDVDDKIIKKGREDNISPLYIAEKYIKEFGVDYSRLKLNPHDQNPRCTHYIKDMTEMIEGLIEKGFAYEIDGEVFFEIKKFKDYGKLSGKNIEELQAGHRVDPDPRKRSPLDFVLWKPSKEGEPSWDSPWGKGRPGWHIECSCMNYVFFGEQIDIHGGGIDLTFPHHENEIAQSEAFTGKPFVKYWMHNNFIKFGDQKMSKSLGNVVKAREFMDRYDQEILKFLLLSVHYRSMLNLDDAQVKQAIGRLGRIYTAIKIADDVVELNKESAELDQEFRQVLDKAEQDAVNALNEDFNTPQLLAAVFDVVRAFNSTFENKRISGFHKARAAAFKVWMSKYGKLTALFREPADHYLRNLDLILLQGKQINVKDIEGFISEREQARKDKNFQKADEIRDKLAEDEIILQDTPQGTTWEVKKG